jgi:hypothetical protein
MLLAILIGQQLSAFRGLSSLPLVMGLHYLVPLILFYQHSLMLTGLATLMTGDPRGDMLFSMVQI